MLVKNLIFIRKVNHAGSLTLNFFKYQIGLAHNPYGIQFPTGGSIESLLSTVAPGHSQNQGGHHDRLHATPSGHSSNHRGGEEGGSSLHHQGGQGFLDKEHEREILERERSSRYSRPEIIHPLDLKQAPTRLVISSLWDEIVIVVWTHFRAKWKSLVNCDVTS